MITGITNILLLTISIIIIIINIIIIIIIRKSPPINILLYNAIGGSGDELYGIEPAMYYIKNLALNTGISWPLALITPIILLISLYSYIIIKAKNSDLWIDYSLFIVYLSALIWLIMLFMRPHKEERFMYPIYPILCLMGSNSLLYCLDMLNYFISIIFKDEYVIIMDENNKSYSKKVINLLLKFIIIINLFLGISRIISNFNNFGGYNKLWINLKNQIDVDYLDLYKDSNTLIQPQYIAKSNSNSDIEGNIIFHNLNYLYFIVFTNLLFYLILL
jgi:hypothetical protein